MPRVIITEPPFTDFGRDYWFRAGDWPARWVDHPARLQGQTSVALFRLFFTVDEPTTIQVHVTADNRYLLMLDGQPVGRGPERSDPTCWSFESYELELASGMHAFVAMNWWLGDHAPQAQMTVRSGFLFAAGGAWQERLSTGIAPWEASLVAGITLLPAPDRVWGTGGRVRIDGMQYPWGWETGTVGEWQPVASLTPGMSASIKGQYFIPTWLLAPATLPPMREERKTVGTLRYLVDACEAYPVAMTRHLANDTAQWVAWLAGQGTLTIPAHTVRKAIIDLENYYCAYPELRVSGGKGAVISLKWDEALYVDFATNDKGNRDEIEGKSFFGVGDEFLLDGKADREFVPLWWMAGRYLELTVVTDKEPVTLHALSLIETGYPLRWEGAFDSADARLGQVIPVGLRSLQMCAHETYMDCPYYEQMMYVGDTRLEVLTTYAMTRDDRLPRKAIRMFDASRLLSGMTRSQYPSRIVQIIPPFSLWWVGMVHDFWQWRNDPSFVREMMPGVRSVMEAFRTLMRPDGLMGPPRGWNFTDWAAGWKDGVPPYGQEHPSGVLNLHFALTLLYKADLEAYFGELALAARDRATAQQLMKTVLSSYWHDERGLIADSLDGKSFSEHAQCLAILTGLLEKEQQVRVVEGVLHADDLTRTTVYFSHYLFETLYRVGRMDRMFDRLGIWFDQRSRGMITTCEQPEPSRSDCHAWGAHPIYHYFASLLGIRPAGAGFRHARIAPAMGPLAWVRGTLPHPDGDLVVDLRKEGCHICANIVLPQGVAGAFVWDGRNYELPSGRYELML